MLKKKWGSKDSRDYWKAKSNPFKHFQKHNRAVERRGFCPACRRLKSKYESKIASK
jgi:hypothetical protein